MSPVLFLAGLALAFVLLLARRRRSRRPRSTAPQSAQFLEVGAPVPSRLRDPETGEVL